MMSMGKLFSGAVAAVAFAGMTGVASAQISTTPLIYSGFTGEDDPNMIPVDFVSDGEASGEYYFYADLIFDPTLPPMIKAFQSPFEVTGQTLIIGPDDGAMFPVWEEFYLVPDPIPGTPYETSKPVSDWHEEILTPGWQWFYIPELLITRNGDPIDWFPQDMPADMDPNTAIWAEFDPILPGEILDIHKYLVWVGADGNRTWGDFQDDLGNFVDESYILVREYPTPEPASLALLGLGSLALLRRR